MHVTCAASGFTRVFRLICVAILVMAMTIPSFAGIAAADIPYDDDPWQGYQNHDIVYRGVWSRSSLLANIGQFRPYGMNENFAYYCNEQTLVVQRYDSRKWASKSSVNSNSTYSNGRWWTGLNAVFNAGGTIRAYTWGSTFIAKVCGNHSPSISNPSPPRISGYKWNDLDGDGTWDSGEPAISGWTMKLYRGGTLVRSTQTNSSGYYSFLIDGTAGLAPDTYVVREADKSGWIHTTAVSRSVTIQSGSYSAGRNYSGNNFGNFELGSIEGIKWSDNDMDGELDSSELPVPGISVLLKKNGVVVATAITGSTGEYKFSDLTAGTYRVEEVLPAGWDQTYPADPPYYDRAITSGKEYTDCDFGNVQFGSIKPLKIHDRNMNQWRDADEELLAGWTMRLWTPTGAELRDPIVTTDETATSPAWEAVSSGEYMVGEDAQPDYAPTGPTTQTVTVQPGQQTIVSFLNVGLGSINGHKFHDHDRDGQMTPTDDPIENWRITLSQDGEMLAETLTDVAGFYEFDGLLPGTYRVCEEERDNWVRMTSPCETATITPLSSARIDFGNLEVGDIEGSKYQDVDGDGAFDPNEPPVQGVSVALTTLDGGFVGTPTTTDSNGSYSFSNVVPGDYVVTETVTDGWAASAGTTRSVTVMGGITSVVDPFLNVKLGSISGMKFDDCNANHTRDLGSVDETGLPGWEIQLWADNDGVWSLAQTALTGAEGDYSFEGVWPGTYQLQEVQKDNWRQTQAPESPVLTSSGSNIGGQDFGNIELAGLDLYKWDDSNSNGVWEPSETGIPGWEFTIEGTQVDGSAVSTVAVTGDDGRVSLSNLLPGTFSATEESIGRTLEPNGKVIEPGWRATTPPTASLELAEGSRESTSFGNIHLGWIWGRVTHEVYGYGVPNIPITLEETDETVSTNSEGFYFFYDVEPNETSETPTPDYLIGMDLSGTSYLTNDAVNKSAYVPEGGNDFVPFTIIDGGIGNCPRTIGYWKNWKNHYSVSEMQAFLDLVNAGSNEFNNLTPADVYQVIQVDRKTSMEGKARAQFLAFWLNVASGKLGWLTQVDVAPVDDYGSVINSADESGLTTVIGFLYDIEDAFTNSVNTNWELVKDLLDFFNNGRLT